MTSLHSKPLALKNVTVTDSFWRTEQELVRTAVIPYQWNALNDNVPGAAPSYCMHNFNLRKTKTPFSNPLIHTDSPFSISGPLSGIHPAAIF